MRTKRRILPQRLAELLTELMNSCIELVGVRGGVSWGVFAPIRVTQLCPSRDPRCRRRCGGRTRSFALIRIISPASPIQRQDMIVAPLPWYDIV